MSSNLLKCPYSVKCVEVICPMRKLNRRFMTFYQPTVVFSSFLHNGHVLYDTRALQDIVRTALSQAFFCEVFDKIPGDILRKA